mmetsp:Transcript_147377/g.260551  ORF Transcript_147377/g.260551 Transcript_147377/m.260551 type:complete len:573 (+) Transcript_147377:110-1828(+)
MLGRKAILHTSKAGQKRKWQREQEKDSDDDSSSDIDAAESDAKSVDSNTEAAKTEKQGAQAADGGASGRNGASASKAEEEDKDDDGSDESDDGGGTKGKRFAWMDSDDEVSDGDEEEGAAAKAGRSGEVAANQTSKALDTSFPPKPPANLGSSTVPPAPVSNSAGGLPTPAMPSSTAVRLPTGLPFQPVFKLPPATKLPSLTQDHLALMVQIANIRTLSELWDIVDSRGEKLVAAHASTALFRLSVLTAPHGSPSAALLNTTNLHLAPGGAAAASAIIAGAADSVDPSLQRHSSFMRLRDRIDELLATAQGRRTFLPADLAMSASSLAKVVPLPATEGATGRIFADIADEAESRLSKESQRDSFTSAMIGDLAWAITKSGHSSSVFLRTVVDACIPKLPEMLCQDLANLAAAYAEQTIDEAEVLLHGIFQQTKQRLGYNPLLPNVAQASETSLQNGERGTRSSASPSREKPLPAWQLLGQWKFTGAQISEIVLAASKRAGVYDEGLFTLVARQFLPRLQELNGPQLQKLREAFDIMRHDVNGEFMRAVRLAQIQRNLSTRFSSSLPMPLPRR